MKYLGTHQKLCTSHNWMLVCTPKSMWSYVRADATLHRVHAPIQQMYINGETPSGLYSKLVQVPSSYWFLQQTQRSCHKQGSSADQISAVLLGSFRSHIFRPGYGQLNTLRGLSHRWCSRFELQLQGWKPFSAKLGIVFSWYTKWLLCSVVDHDTLAYGVNGSPVYMCSSSSKQHSVPKHVSWFNGHQK